MTAREAFTDSETNMAKSIGARRTAISPGGSGGWQERPDTGGTNLSKETPIGEPWILFLIAVWYTVYKLLRQRKTRFLLLLLSFIPNLSIAGITSLSINNGNGVAAGGEIVLLPTLSGVPSGTVFLCWGLYHDEECTNEVEGIRFSRDLSAGANAVICPAPSTGRYFVKSSLHTGNVCGGLTDSYVVTPIDIYPADADVVLAREAQGSAQRIDICDTPAAKAYGAMRFCRATLSDESLSAYARYNYFISFPFDVQVADIHGIGEVGSHWLIYYYDGKGRAEEGFFAERTDNWVMIDDTDSVLHAGQGYLLQLNAIQMSDDATWTDDADALTLFFPSLSSIGSITMRNETIPALGDAYRCTIDLSASLGSEGDRRIKDSYWRCIGTPGFSSPTGVSALDYLYEWDMSDNSLKVVSSEGFDFQPMHAYLIQNGGEIVWTGVTKPEAILARNAERNYDEWRIEILQDGETQDRTYVRMTESASAGFDFGHDLIKECSAGKANIYTMERYERLAANCLPVSDSLTVIPVGVRIATDGEYTFAMAEGKDAVLVDYTANVRTHLGLEDYTVFLTSGEINDRFAIEILPDAATPTGNITPPLSQGEGGKKARKVLKSGRLYIWRDGKLYDVRGTQL